MDSSVFIILLAASAFQAAWNARIKAVKLDSPIAKAALLNAFGAVIGVLLVLSFGPPSKAAYLYLFSSAIVTYLYLHMLMQSYQIGEMTQVLAITRGAALVLVAVVGSLFGESLKFIGWIGIFNCRRGCVFAFNTRCKKYRSL
jgi:hypothetical protein